MSCPKCLARRPGKPALAAGRISSTQPPIQVGIFGMDGGGAEGGRPAPELSEGTKIPGEPVFLVPSPSPGWTWPLRFRTLASASARRTPVMVSCILSRSWSPAFHEVEPRAVHRSRSGSRRSPLGPKPLKDPLGLDPAPRSLRSENPPVASGQRAGPVRFEPRVSPDFRAAVSLGLLTFAPNPVDGKRPNPAGCAEPPRPRWTTLCISVGGPKSRKRISGLRFPQKAVRSSVGRRSSHG